MALVMRVAPVLTSADVSGMPSAPSHVVAGTCFFLLGALVVSLEIPSAIDLFLALESTSLGCNLQDGCNKSFQAIDHRLFLHCSLSTK